MIDKREAHVSARENGEHSVRGRKFGEMIMANDSAESRNARKLFLPENFTVRRAWVKWRDIYCVVRDEKEIRKD